jgi:hypothetical protein
MPMSEVFTRRRVLCHMEGNRVIEDGPAPDWRVPPPVDPDPGSPNGWLSGGQIIQGSRCYTAADGKINFKGDIVFLMALSRAEPGSEMEEFVRRGVRNVPVFHPTHELGLEEKKRLDHLKRSPYEPSKAQIEDREKMRAILLDHLASLG